MKKKNAVSSEFVAQLMTFMQQQQEEVKRQRQAMLYEQKRHQEAMLEEQTLQREEVRLELEQKMKGLEALMALVNAPKGETSPTSQYWKTP